MDGVGNGHQQVMGDMWTAYLLGILSKGNAGKGEENSKN
ncbi:hypothetical protein COLO4_06555 [Corchorus olitorius]|uniref:Uncharacterized protein n=1 Tax=Corchorus olitorius TaxID=93759 RepID=A0A1R3KMY3_9ROSI|nr:hypothetical protein COLO4_06555 [Corchorus olitorius]